MHYRVSIYNYFSRRFREQGWELSVLADELQSTNQNPLEFGFSSQPFGFWRYRRAILAAKPDAVILFLHLKDRMLWPLIHWLKLSRIPVAVWTKGRNLDDPHNKLHNLFFDYLHWLSDALILYTDSLIKYVPKRERHKVFIANNTINILDFPCIDGTRDDIKRQLGIPFRHVVLFVGRIGESGNRKKVDHLIEIFRTWERPDVGLVIVGSGLTSDLRARINHANTMYFGEVHDPHNLAIARLFTVADICSIPGHVGLGLNQAFFFGLPVVTEQGRQPPEIDYLEDGRNGFIVAEDDVDELRRRLLFLVDNESERARMSRNAKDDITRRASIEGMFQGFLQCVTYLSSGARADREFAAGRASAGESRG